MLGDYATAYSTYLKASQLDPSFNLPLYGMIFCRIKQDMFDDAIQQLEFVKDNLEGGAKIAEHCFLEAMIEWRVKGNKSGAISCLDAALNLHIQ